MAEQEVRMSRSSGSSSRVPNRKDDTEVDSGRLSPLAQADDDLLMEVEGLSLTEDRTKMPPPGNLLTLAEIAVNHDRMAAGHSSASPSSKRVPRANSDTFTIERHDANLLVRVGGEG